MSTGASLQGVVLEDAFGNRIEAEEASVDALGNGRGRSVHAELTVDEQGGPQNQPGLEPEMKIDSDRSEWNLKERTVVFEGNVRVTRGAVNLQCQTLNVSLGESSAIESAIAGGHVYVQQGARKASSEEAALDAKSGQLILTGNPVVEEDGRSMRGQRIILWLDDDRMTCDDCTVVLDSPGIERNE